jgi:hypothetical protein
VRHRCALTASLSGRPPQFDERREHIITFCARGAFSLTRHGRSKRGLGPDLIRIFNDSPPAPNANLVTYACALQVARDACKCQLIEAITYVPQYGSVVLPVGLNVDQSMGPENKPLWNAVKERTAEDNVGQSAEKVHALSASLPNIYKGYIPTVVALDQAVVADTKAGVAFGNHGPNDELERPTAGVW